MVSTGGADPSAEGSAITKLRHLEWARAERVRLAAQSADMKGLMSVSARHVIPRGARNLALKT